MADPTFARDMVQFLNEAWTCFHAVQAAKERLRAAGFQELQEREPFEGQIVAGRSYFFTRNMSSLVAFSVGAKYEPGNGFTLVGAHSDSPCPKLKPVSKCSRGNCDMVGVAGYGGGLWHTWFDRDLTVAGRVLVRDGAKLVHRLVKIPRPILRTSTLAIHLTKGDERSSFSPNLQQHFYPALATAIKESALLQAKKADGESKEDKPAHSPLLLQLLSEHLSVPADAILDFDLQLCDTQPSTIGGAAEEFIYSGRLDNLCSSYQGLRALVDTANSLESESRVRLLAIFDHEEVGSSSATGACSPLLPDTFLRVAQALTDHPLPLSIVPRTHANSFCVSADMAHALHPNYPDRHDPALQPQLHKGIVIKHNQNQRYATNAVTARIFKECCAKDDVPLQEFAVRSDMGCGSTIGPITASLTGVRTVDVGSPQWSMHSIREVMGTDDAFWGYAAIKACFKYLTEVDESLVVDGTSADTPRAEPAPKRAKRSAA